MSENQGAAVPRRNKGAAVPQGTVSAIKEFLGAHGGTASAVIQPIGRIGVRITLVGADGVLGDQVVKDLATANAVVAALPEVEIAEWDRALTSVATPAPGHARKMAGWVANT